LAYVLTGGNLLVFDVTNPASPALLGSRDLSGQASHISAAGSFAYVADEDLLVFDCNDPSSPHLRGSYSTPSSAIDVFVSGPLAYVADFWSGLWVLRYKMPLARTNRWTRYR